LAVGKEGIISQVIGADPERYAVLDDVPVKNGVPVVGEMYTESARKAGSSYCAIAGNGAEILEK